MNDVLREVIARLQVGPTKAGSNSSASGALSGPSGTGQVRTNAIGREQQSVAAIQQRLMSEPSMVDLINPFGALGQRIGGALSADGSPVVSAEPSSMALDAGLPMDTNRFVAEDMADRLGQSRGSSAVTDRGESSVGERIDRRIDDAAQAVELPEGRIAPPTGSSTDVAAIAETLKDELRPMFDELGAQLLRRVRSEGQGRHFRLRANDVD